MSREIMRRARVLGLSNKISSHSRNWPRHCERCGDDMVKMGPSSLSFYNWEWLCLACKLDEMTAPGYEIAEAAFWQAIDQGDLGYSGIGITEEVRVHLAGRFKLRPRRVVN